MSVTGEQWAACYAAGLLREVNFKAAAGGRADHPAVAWARSGLMAVTGWPAGAGLMCPLPLAAAADGAMQAFAAVAGLGAVPCGAALLGQRARLLALAPGGTRSAGGSCRLLPARDGWIALNLARVDDWAAVPAWLEAEIPLDLASIAAAVRRGTADALVARGRLLGLAVARADGDHAAPAWCIDTPGFPAVPPGMRQPLVVDLSSLWAGPLAGALLRLAGAEVIKVESVARPDGARQGHAGFFDWLNGGKSSVALDLCHADGRAALHDLLLRADIVIESTRPRALRQMGIFAEEVLAGHPGQVWVSITGYGREGDGADWIGFGDDAAVAAGLAGRMSETFGHMLCAGDAVADPLTGMHAAVAALAAWRQGGGRLLALSLAGVVARAMQLGADVRGAALAARTQEWTHLASKWAARPYALPAVTCRARALGADNAAHLGAASEVLPVRQERAR